MNVLVAGHSFVRRLAFDVRVRKLDLSTSGTRIRLHGKGGATIGDPKPIDRDITGILSASKFDFVILDLGSNDLDPIRHPNWEPEVLAQAYFQKGAKISTSFGIKVVLCLPIPRHEEQFPGSFDRTRKFNEVVKTLSESNPKVFTWSHKGLFKKDNRFMDKHGVHLNSLGSIRYFHSIKAAIRFHSAKFI